MTTSIYKRKQIVKKWFTWYTIRQIAQELKISRKTVRKYLILEGLITRDLFGCWWYQRSRNTQYYRFYRDYNNNYYPSRYIKSYKHKSSPFHNNYNNLDDNIEKNELHNFSEINNLMDEITSMKHEIENFKIELIQIIQSIKKDFNNNPKYQNLNNRIDKITNKIDGFTKNYMSLQTWKEQVKVLKDIFNEIISKINEIEYDIQYNHIMNTSIIKNEMQKYNHQSQEKIEHQLKSIYEKFNNKLEILKSLESNTNNNESGEARDLYRKLLYYSPFIINSLLTCYNKWIEIQQSSSK